MTVILEKTCPHCKVAFDPKHQQLEDGKVVCPYCGTVIKPTKEKIN